MAIELRVGAPDNVEGRTTIYRFDDGVPFAVGLRHEMLRCSDGRAWAYVSGDRLISRRSGRCLAVRVGSVYYDPESREPMYYELPSD